MTCKAVQKSDQMVCSVCDLVWDVNDFSPPRCGKTCRGYIQSRETRKEKILGFDDQVKFDIGSDTVTVSFDNDGRLTVRSEGQLMINPQASNTIVLTTRRF